MACLSLLGLVGLGYLCGVAVMFFQLPTSDFMNKALTGAKAWQERGRPEAARRTRSGGMGLETVRVDREDKTYDGFTLYTTTEGARATLIDMRGETVHEWALPFSKAWPRPPRATATGASGRCCGRRAGASTASGCPGSGGERRDACGMTISRAVCLGKSDSACEGEDQPSSVREKPAPCVLNARPCILAQGLTCSTVKHRPIFPSGGSSHEATLALGTPARGRPCLVRRRRL